MKIRNAIKRRDTWMYKNKSSRVHPASTPGSSGQLLENSQACRTKVQVTQEIFCLYYIKITGNRQENRNP